jgi:hypothetical protein
MTVTTTQHPNASRQHRNATRTRAYGGHKQRTLAKDEHSGDRDRHCGSRMHERPQHERQRLHGRRVPQQQRDKQQVWSRQQLRRGGQLRARADV